MGFPLFWGGGTSLLWDSVSQKVRVGITDARYPFCGLESVSELLGGPEAERSSSGLGSDGCLVREACLPGSSVLLRDQQLGGRLSHEKEGSC